MPSSFASTHAGETGSIFAVTKISGSFAVDFQFWGHYGVNQDPTANGIMKNPPLHPSFTSALVRRVSARRGCSLGLLATVLWCAALVPPARGQPFELLHSFQNSDGGHPYAGLVQGSDGNFYGTTYDGGASLLGTVFKITASGTFTNLVTFNGNGAYPWAALVQGSDGDFYGTTTAGGSNNFGTVFKMTPSGSLTSLVSFNGTNGQSPIGRLVQGIDGYFYGTTSLGGTNNGYGTVFKVTTNGALTNFVSFNGANGLDPFGELVQASDGDLYGTTRRGGTTSRGTVFKITTNGTSLTTLFDFITSNSFFGMEPRAGLVQASDGDLYGTAADGGTSPGGGTVFKIKRDGTLLTRLVTFNYSLPPNVAHPMAGLIQARDGNFYGTTYDGGTNGNYGTVFKMTPGGNLKIVVSFSGNGGAYSGSKPRGTLVQGTDGNLYGTTENGGTNGYGTVFRILFTPVSATNVTFGAGGALTLGFQGGAGFNYDLEASTNLQSWQVITNQNAGANGQLQFILPDTTNYPQRFYRARF